MNKIDLVRNVAEEVALTKKDAAKAVEAIFDAISDELAKGEKVTLVGFGTFQAVDRAKKIGVNPATGEKLEISSRTVPKFKAGKSLKEAVRS